MPAGELRPESLIPARGSTELDFSEIAGGAVSAGLASPPTDIKALTTPRLSNIKIGDFVITAWILIMNSRENHPRRWLCRDRGSPILSTAPLSGFGQARSDVVSLGWTTACQSRRSKYEAARGAGLHVLDAVRCLEFKRANKPGGYRTVRTVSCELQGNRNEMARDATDRFGEREG